MNINNNKNISSICFFSFDKKKPKISQQTIDSLISNTAVQSIYVATECIVKKTPVSKIQKKTEEPAIPASSTPITEPPIKEESRETKLAKILGLTHKEKDIFSSREGREFGLTSFIQRMTNHDMSGILNDKERLISSPHEFETLISLAECVCPSTDVDALKVAKQQLIRLKTTFLEAFGFLKDKGGLLERLSLLSAVLSYPLAFGAQDRDDTTDRAALLFEIKKYMDTKWPMDFKTGCGRNANDPCWFPCNQFSTTHQQWVEERYSDVGVPLNFKPKDQKYSGIFLNREQNGIVHRNPLFLPVRGFIEKCVLRSSNSDGVCINDEAPNYFMGLFPPGMYFVESEYDYTPFNERLKTLGGFAQAVLKPK